MNGFARFWLTSLALCVEDIALMARDAAIWAHHQLTDHH